MWEQCPPSTRVSEEVEEGGASGTETDSTAVPGADHGETAVPLHGGQRECADAPAACRGGDFGTGRCAWRRLTPWEYHAVYTMPCREEKPTLQKVCWQDLSPHGRPALRQPIPEGLHPMQWAHIRAVHEELQHMGRTPVDVCRGLSLWEGPHTTAGEEWEEEGATETYRKLNRVPLYWRERIQEWNWIQEEGKGGGKVFLRFGFNFSLPHSDLIGELIFPSCACESDWWLTSPCPYLSPWTCYSLFSPLPS